MRRLADAVESAHMGHADFRVGGRIFATLASAHLGYGNLMLTVAHQHELITARPDLYLPIAGGWGRQGMTHIRLDVADEASLTHALHTAWALRVEKNGKRTRRSR